MKWVFGLVLIVPFSYSQDLLKLSDSEIGLFSSVGFGRSGIEKIQGGYSNIFGKLSFKTRNIFGFEFGIGGSATGLLYRVKNQDIYSDISDNEIGIGFRINNDEAKDFRYTSTPFLLHTLYVSYQNSWGSLSLGRFPLELQWIGDYLQGVSVSIDRFKNWEIKAGYFNAQAYSDPQENVYFGYIKHWYEYAEGYHIKNNYFLDIKYHHPFFDLDMYYDYFDTLLGVAGVKMDLNFAYNDWGFKTHFHNAFIAASIQTSQSCKDPLNAHMGGLACYVAGSEGKLKGYLWQLEQSVRYKNWDFSLGYLQNDKRNSTNNLPIYADDSPLEYNSVLYGGGAKSVYGLLGYAYNKRYFLNLRYGLSYYNDGTDMSLQNQFNAIGAVDISRMRLSLGYINIFDRNGYQNNITKLWVGFRF